jgi:hypothetical protein
VRRRVGVALAAGALALAVVPTAATWGAEGDAPGPVAVVSDGWWNQLGVPGGVPANPVTGLLPIPAQPTVDVPEGVVAVAMRFGQVQRVGAIGMTMEAQGAEVRSLVLQLKESGEPLAQQGTGGGVQACPITDFLVPEEGGETANTPRADCTIAKADGVRADDGTWRFDLTAIGQAWASGAVSVNGVRLDPVGAAPATFQVGFTGIENARLEQDVSVSATSDPFALDSGGDAFSSGSFDSGSAFTDPGTFETPEAVTPPPTQVSAPTRETVSLASTSDDRGFVGSALSMLLLVLALLVLGLAVTWSQGEQRTAAVAVPARHARRATRAAVRRVGASRHA